MRLLTFLLLIAPSIIFAQAERIFQGVQLNDSLDTVSKKLYSISGSTNVFTINNPVFPLAKNREDHLVCSKVNTDNGIIDKVVFTFADGKLCYIEARGNTVETLLSNRKDTARTYMDYIVYAKDKLFVNKKKDAAWILTEEAMHTNLFSWDNPYLNVNYKENTKTISSSEIPSFLRMGVTLDEIKPILEANSRMTSTEELDGTDPNAQLQINCFGVDYLGFPRKVEARFGNDRLNVVWILTAKGEEDRIRKALIEQYGEAIFVDKAWEIFNNWQVALRKDKPEVLLMEQEIGLEYKTSYFKQ